MLYGTGYPKLTAVFVFLVIVGCSGSREIPFPATESHDFHSHINASYSQRTLWGIWDISFDIDDMSATIEPARSLQGHYNITSMLQSGSCEDCMTVTINSFNSGTRILDADLTLRNMFKITGYDVRGIVFTDDAGYELTNPDDWTALWDIPGGDDTNPFRAYAKSMPNRIFAPMNEHTENYLIYVPYPPQWSQITYAVDASFPGNCLEPYEIANFSQDVIYHNSGSIGNICVDVRDWQADVNRVVILAPDITGEQITDFKHVGGETWVALITNNTGAPKGVYEECIIASSQGSGMTYIYDRVDLTITFQPLDLDMLFAPLRTFEIADVRNEWMLRDVSVKDFLIEGEETKPDGSRLIVISHTIDGERHYGAVRIPPGVAGPNSAPVLCIAHPGNEGANDYMFRENDFVGDNFIQLLPSFRGEPLLIIDGPLSGVYQSEGTSSPNDRDADDMIAMLSAVVDNIPEADETRIALYGASRGGGAAMLTKIRDLRIDAVAVLFGATDFFTDDIKAAAQHHLDDPSFMGNNPLENAIITKVIDPLLHDELTIPEARHLMLLSSPVYFAKGLPRIQVHHGTDDDVVPILQSDRLEEVMNALGIGAPDYVYYRYPGGTHDPGSLPGYMERVEKLLQWVMELD